MAWSFNYDCLWLYRIKEKMKRLALLSILVLIIFISIILFIFLINEKDPNKPPSALLNKEIPEFELNNLF